MRTQRIEDIDIIRDYVEIPGIGTLAINAFLLNAEQPVLVDTGRPVERESFLKELQSAIDLTELRWIWLTHPDRDHMGSLFDILAAAPQARLVTTYAAAGYLTVEFPVPMDRVYLLNPGQELAIGGGRTLRAFRPPLFDSPMTVGFFDSGTNFCISSDCFGAPMPTMDAADVDDVAMVDADILRAAQLLWSAVDSPWVHTVDRDRFAATYDVIRDVAPTAVLSTHLPPARGQTDTFLEFLAEAPSGSPFVGPDQGALEAMLAGAPH
jgi:hypothetical protein